MAWMKSAAESLLSPLAAAGSGMKRRTHLSWKLNETEPEIEIGTEIPTKELGAASGLRLGATDCPGKEETTEATSPAPHQRCA